MAIGVYSRYANVRPLKDATAEFVLWELHLHPIAILGFPLILQDDDGRSFDNHLLRTELERYGISPHRTTPHNHKSQGVVERDNRMIFEII